MNIKPILVSLESEMERNDLIEQMVLLPGLQTCASKQAKCTESANFVVGYNASPRSQTALALTMWIAHQTRLATQKQVTVQVVYVVDENHVNHTPCVPSSPDARHLSIPRSLLKGLSQQASSNASTSILKKQTPQDLKTASPTTSKKSRRSKGTFSQADWFEQADRILWQARCMAEEWRGCFKAHLRFGDIATELRAVVESEAATLLFLGCHSIHHPLVEKLGSDFPCAVLGIPTKLSWQQELPSFSGCSSF